MALRNVNRWSGVVGSAVMLAVGLGLTVKWLRRMWSGGQPTIWGPVGVLFVVLAVVVIALQIRQAFREGRGSKSATRR